jgi:hypothetical protein
MPIHKEWHPATEDHVSLNVPGEAGVYELKSFGTLVYVGRAEDLSAAMLDTLDERTPNYYRYRTLDLMEDLETVYRQHLDRYEDEHGQLPAWNRSEAAEEEPAAEN